MNWLTELRALFCRIPINTLIIDELYEAKRELLKAQTASEHAAALVTFREKQVMRLNSLVERELR